MSDTIHVLGIAGSLRSGSYNRLLVRAAQSTGARRHARHEFDLADVPFFDADVEERGDPEAVVALKRAVRGADALLIATPEYQHACQASSRTRSTGRRARRATRRSDASRSPSWAHRPASSARRVPRSTCARSSPTTTPRSCSGPRSWSRTRSRPSTPTVTWSTRRDALPAADAAEPDGVDPSRAGLVAAGGLKTPVRPRSMPPGTRGASPDERAPVVHSPVPHMAGRDRMDASC
jgi:hypothetical protein